MNGKGLMSNSLYDKLKFVAQIVLPAGATLYAALYGRWKRPYNIW